MTRKLTSIDEALKIILAKVSVCPAMEEVALGQSLNRILGSDLLALVAVPGTDNSAMDGYAVNSLDLTSTPATLKVVQRIAAGEVGEPLQKGCAARIFTGAPLPVNADAVVMQENCEVNGEQVRVLQSIEAGENVRYKGEDIRQGFCIFKTGHRITVKDMGVLAASGIATLRVRKPLKVAVLTTGDELVRPGNELTPGQIYNSNFFVLASLLQALGIEVIDIGIVADRFEATVDSLSIAADQADCVITSGGVSMGEEDHVRDAVEKLGQLDVWKLAIKPGKPFAFGSVAAKTFFGLPGNPVSAFVTFVLLVRPALLAMAGATPMPTISYQLPARFSLTTGQRREFLRVKVVFDSQANQELEMFSSQSSGVGSSISRSDGLAEVPPFTAIKAGNLLKFIPFSELIN